MVGLAGRKATYLGEGPLVDTTRPVRPGGPTRGHPHGDPWPDERAIAPPQDYASGITVFRQGEPVRILYLIDDGFVKLTRSEPSGWDVLIGLRGPCWLLGAAAGLLGLPHPIAAQTVTTCILRPLTKDDYLRLLRTHPQIAQWVQRMQAREAYEQVALLGGLGALSPRQRLERFLCRQIPRGSVALGDGRVQLTLPLRYQELAQAIAVAPETLSRLFAELQADGVIVRKGGRLQIPKDSPLLQLSVDLPPFGK
jgi:CRP/FNR family transcriptional regulator